MISSLLILLFASDKAIVEFTQDIISLCFEDVRSLMYLEESIFFVTKSIFATYRSIINGGHANLATNIGGYVLFNRKLRSIQNHTFLPNRRIFIFLSEKRCIESLVFKENRVILVTGYNFSNVGFSVQVFDMWNGIAIAAWVYESERKIYSDDLGTDLIHPLSLLNATITVLAFDMPPYITVEDKKVVRGMEKTLIKYLTIGLDVKYVVLPPDSWEDCRELLRNKTYDITVGGHGKNYANSSEVDTSISYIEALVTLLVPKPKLLPLETLVFQHLHVDVWIGIGLFALTTATVYFCTLKWIIATSSFTYAKTLLEVLGTLLFNPRNSLASIASLRPMFIVLNIMSLFIFTLYTAGVTTGIASPPYYKPVKTFKDIIDNSLTYSYEYIPMLVSHSDTPYASKIATIPTLYNPLKKSQMYSAQVYNNYVFMKDSTVSMDRRRALALLKEYLSNLRVGHVLQKDSPYTNPFNRKQQMFSEHGLIEAWLMIALHENIEILRGMSGYFSYYSERFGDKSPLDLFKLQGVFYLLFAGYTIAAARFLYEYFSMRSLGNLEYLLSCFQLPLCEINA